MADHPQANEDPLPPPHPPMPAASFPSLVLMADIIDSSVCLAGLTSALNSDTADHDDAVSGPPLHQLDAQRAAAAEHAARLELQELVEQAHGLFATKRRDAAYAKVDAALQLVQSDPLLQGSLHTVWPEHEECFCTYGLPEDSRWNGGGTQSGPKPFPVDEARGRFVVRLYGKRCLTCTTTYTTSGPESCAALKHPHVKVSQYKHAFIQNPGCPMSAATAAVASVLMQPGASSGAGPSSLPGAGTAGQYAAALAGQYGSATDWEGKTFKSWKKGTGTEKLWVCKERPILLWRIEPGSTDQIAAAGRGSPDTGAPLGGSPPIAAVADNTTVQESPSSTLLDTSARASGSQCQAPQNLLDVTATHGSAQVTGSSSPAAEGQGTSGRPRTDDATMQTAKAPRGPPPEWLESREEVFGALQRCCTIQEWRNIVGRTPVRHLVAMRLDNGQQLAHWLVTPAPNLDDSRRDNPPAVHPEAPITQDQAIEQIKVVIQRIGLPQWRKLLQAQDDLSMATPLHRACRFGHRTRVLELVLGNAPRRALLIHSKHCWLPFHTAARSSHEHATRAVLQATWRVLHELACARVQERRDEMAQLEEQEATTAATGIAAVADAVDGVGLPSQVVEMDERQAPAAGSGASGAASGLPLQGPVTAAAGPAQPVPSNELDPEVLQELAQLLCDASYTLTNKYFQGRYHEHPAGQRSGHEILELACQVELQRQPEGVAAALAELGLALPAPAPAGDTWECGEKLRCLTAMAAEAEALDHSHLV